VCHELHAIPRERPSRQGFRTVKSSRPRNHGPTPYPPRDRSVAALLAIISLTPDATDLHSLACDRPRAGMPGRTHDLAPTPKPRAGQRAQPKE